MINLRFPTPHALQQEILDSTAPRKIIVTGRQVGKTLTAGLSAIGGRRNGGRGILDGASVHISSTSQDQSDVLWQYITKWLAPIADVNPRGWYKNESRRIVRMNGGQIRVKTGRDPDALRGGTVDKLILDECAYLDARAWGEVGQPMLLATDGVAELYSTPKRRNWFFHLYQQALDSDDWQVWHAPTTVNPHLSRDALRLITENMTEEAYRQEIEAQFLEGQGAVFRYISERATATRCTPYTGRFVAGLDWAQASDYTVMVLLDADTGTMVDYDRFNQVDWSVQRSRVRAMYDKWLPGAIVAESNSIGGPNIEALQAEGLPVLGFQTTASSKPPLIESLVLAFDRGEIAIMNDPIITGELMAYERQVSATGRSQYSAPAGLHDDTVIALALAWYGVTNTTTAWEAFIT